jgi:CRP-like cAMP-binding protein
MTIAQQLAEIPLFRGVKQADRERLTATMRRQTYQPGDILFRQGDPGDAIYILVTGRVRIFVTDSDGNEMTIRYLTEMVGEWAALDQQPRSTSVAAEETVEALILHRDDFIAFLREHPLVGLAMMRDMAERVRYTTTYLQRILDATNQLARGERIHPIDHDQAVVAENSIQAMIAAFLQMVKGVRERGETFRQLPPTNT